MARFSSISRSPRVRSEARSRGLSRAANPDQNREGTASERKDNQHDDAVLDDRRLRERQDPLSVENRQRTFSREPEKPCTGYDCQQFLPRISRKPQNLPLGFLNPRFSIFDLTPYCGKAYGCRERRAPALCGTPVPLLLRSMDSSCLTNLQ